MKTHTSKTTPDTGCSANGLGTLLERVRAWQNDPVIKRIQPKGKPQLFGNEDFEVGESTIHLITASILYYGLSFHFASMTGIRVFGNLNLFYSTEDPTEYVSPDVMVVRPAHGLPALLTSYRIGVEGPVPLLVSEVLSFRTWQQSDLFRKPMLYSDLGVEEYMIADVTGELLDQRLLMLRRKPNGGWRDEQDADGGITSRLGFRVIIDEDQQLRVIDVKSGRRYARPQEAQTLADQVRALEDELSRLRGAADKKSPGKGRRRKS